MAKRELIDLPDDSPVVAVPAGETTKVDMAADDLFLDNGLEYSREEERRELDGFFGGYDWSRPPGRGRARAGDPETSKARARAVPEAHVGDLVMFIARERIKVNPVVGGRANFTPKEIDQYLSLTYLDTRIVWPENDPKFKMNLGGSTVSSAMNTLWKRDLLRRTNAKRGGSLVYEVRLDTDPPNKIPTVTKKDLFTVVRRCPYREDKFEVLKGKMKSIRQAHSLALNASSYMGEYFVVKEVHTAEHLGRVNDIDHEIEMEEKREKWELTKRARERQKKERKKQEKQEKKKRDEDDAS